MGTAVLLIALWFNPGNGYGEKHFIMPDMETCLRAVDRAKVEYSKGNESEGGAMLFCAERPMR